MNLASLKRGVSIVAAGLVLAGAMPAAASAASISVGSEIAFFGDFDIVGGSDLSSATGMGFSNPVDITAATGDFAGADSGSATFSDFSFDPASLGTILTFANGGAFEATSVDVSFQTANALTLTFTGIWSLDGFDDTAGGLTLSADSLGGLSVFSGTGAVVPVPGALLLLGSALFGLGAVRRKA